MVERFDEKFEEERQIDDNIQADESVLNHSLSNKTQCSYWI